MLSAHSGLEHNCSQAPTFKYVKHLCFQVLRKQATGALQCLGIPINLICEPSGHETPDAVKVHGRKHIIPRASNFRPIINLQGIWLSEDRPVAAWEDENAPCLFHPRVGRALLKHAYAFLYNQGSPGCCRQGTTVAIIKGRQQMSRAIYSNTFYGLAALHKKYLPGLSQD